MKHVLFICSQNRLRSPTAEQVFSSHEAITCVSAGLNNDADNPVTPELVEWADPELIRLLQIKVLPFLPVIHTSR